MDCQCDEQGVGVQNHRHNNMGQENSKSKHSEGAWILPAACQINMHCRNEGRLQKFRPQPILQRHFQRQTRTKSKATLNLLNSGSPGPQRILPGDIREEKQFEE